MALLPTLPIYTGMMFAVFLLPTVRCRTLLILFSQDLAEPLGDGNRALPVFIRIISWEAQQAFATINKFILTYSEYLPPPSKHVVVLLLHCPVSKTIKGTLCIFSGVNEEKDSVQKSAFVTKQRLKSPLAT
ncbi:uncharacterized protein F5147DRAFT_712811, partial [Suillus discolor]